MGRSKAIRRQNRLARRAARRAAEGTYVAAADVVVVEKTPPRTVTLEEARSQVDYAVLRRRMQFRSNVDALVLAREHEKALDALMERQSR